MSLLMAFVIQIVIFGLFVLSLFIVNGHKFKNHKKKT